MCLTDCVVTSWSLAQGVQIRMKSMNTMKTSMENSNIVDMCQTAFHTLILKPLIEELIT